MSTAITRRHFINKTALTGVALSALPAITHLKAQGANNRLRVAVVGCHGRGKDHIAAFTSLPDVEIAYICDVDKKVLDAGVKAAAQNQPTAPKGVKDMREIFDDKTVDAVSFAIPN